MRWIWIWVPQSSTYCKKLYHINCYRHAERIFKYIFPFTFHEPVVYQRDHSQFKKHSSCFKLILLKNISLSFFPCNLFHKHICCRNTWLAIRICALLPDFISLNDIFPHKSWLPITIKDYIFSIVNSRYESDSHDIDIQTSNKTFFYALTPQTTSKRFCYVYFIY